MKINNFKHDFKKREITFQVERKNKIYDIKIKATDTGTSATDYYNFTDTWARGEHRQLEDFVSACGGILHQFYH